MEVIHKSIDCLQLTEDDVVYDIGAGDGRFILTVALNTKAKSVGIELDEERVQFIRERINELSLSSNNKCRVIADNALDVDLSEATSFFLYLVPRGLRIVLPLIRKIPRDNIRVVTYMSPFPSDGDGGIEPVAIHKVSPEAQSDAQWPLFVYTFNNLSRDTN